MDKLLKVLVDGDSYGSVNTFSDKLHFKYSTLICLTFSIILSGKNYASNSIRCWCPSHFTKNHIAYTNKHCWTTNTFIINLNYTDLPKSENLHRIGYYQWVTLILCFQAVLFYIPKPIWIYLNQQNDICLPFLMDEAREMYKEKDKKRKEKIQKFLVKKFHLMLMKYQIESRRSFIKELFKGNQLIVIHIFIKIVYVLDILVNFYMLSRFLDMNFYTYGVEFLSEMMVSGNWHLSKTFPTKTHCDFKIRALGNIQKYVVQCSLPVNLFHQKIFLFLWMWMIFVLLFSVSSLLQSCYIYLPRKTNLKFIKELLIFDSLLCKKTDSESFEHFGKYFLKRDGLFFIRIVAENLSEGYAADIASELWCNYYNENLIKFVST